MKWSPKDNLSSAQRQQIAATCFRFIEIKGGEMMGHCPAHDDNNATNFSYNPDKDACKCFACGFKGDLVTLWGHANGYGDNREAFLAFKERFSDGASPPGGGSPNRGEGAPGAVAVPDADETTQIIPESDWLKLPQLTDDWRARCKDDWGWTDAILDRFDFRLKGDRLAIPIRNHAGYLVNVRLYLPGAGENKIISWGKGFGKGKLFPAPPWPDEQPIILCEGEKDCITALSKGFNAATQTTGADTWSDRYTRFFTGRQVIVAYDNDDAGRKGGEKAAAKIAEVATSVAIIQWPAYMQDKQDLTDFFAVHGKSAADFKRLFPDAKKIGGGTGKKTRAERAAEIPEGQRAFFVGKQFKPRLCADAVLAERSLAYDAKTSLLYEWSGRHWEEIHESSIRHLIITILGQEAKTSLVSDTITLTKDLSIIRGGRSVNDVPGLLPLHNGMFCLDTRTLRDHHPDNLNTYCLQISLRTAQKDLPPCPNFMTFLASFVPDVPTRREIVKYMAYCLTRDVKHELALFLIGPGGDGKSTFIRIMESILGEYNVSNISLGSLEDQFQRVMLKDKLLNVSTEIEGDLLQSGMFKAIVSGDRISASYKHKDAFSFYPVAKHIFAANKFPVMRDTSRGLLRKMMICETERNFSQPDRDLSDKLKGELDGIFHMLVHHLGLLQQEGFIETPYLAKCKAKFAESNNPVIGFSNYCLAEGSPEQTVETMVVYEKYTKYCAKRGYKAKSDAHFGKELKSIYPKIDRKRASFGNRPYIYTGLTLEVMGE